jgi:hypothetical protein
MPVIHVLSSEPYRVGLESNFRSSKQGLVQICRQLLVLYRISYLRTMGYVLLHAILSVCLSECLSDYISAHNEISISYVFDKNSDRLLRYVVS